MSVIPVLTAHTIRFNTAISTADKLIRVATRSAQVDAGLDVLVLVQRYALYLRILELMLPAWVLAWQVAYLLAMIIAEVPVVLSGAVNAGLRIGTYIASARIRKDSKMQVQEYTTSVVAMKVRKVISLVGLDVIVSLAALLAILHNYLDIGLFLLLVVAPTTAVIANPIIHSDHRKIMLEAKKWYLCNLPMAISLGTLGRLILDYAFIAHLSMTESVIAILIAPIIAILSKFTITRIERFLQLRRYVKAYSYVLLLVSIASVLTSIWIKIYLS